MSNEEQILAALQKISETQEQALAIQKLAFESQQKAIASQQIAVKPNWLPAGFTESRFPFWRFSWCCWFTVFPAVGTNASRATSRPAGCRTPN